MNYQLKNDKICVTISSLGAEIISAVRGDCEYMWQKDPKYWDECAPLLFPICGRLVEGMYNYRGKSYELSIHGFARFYEYDVERVGDDALRFTLCDNEKTRAVYPFKFKFSVLYRLSGDALYSEVTVTNNGDDVLPYTFGAHPGFNVPLEKGKALTDYYVKFDKPCAPKKIVMSPACFVTHDTVPYPTDNGKIHLTHEMFDNDAIFMLDIADSVTLECEGAKNYVRVTYPDMPYVGLWKAVHTDAPYVCIEPWCGLPAYDGVIDDFETKEPFIRLKAGENKTVRYSITYGLYGG